jgi:membrane associated rhomboid family serine protease
MGFENRDYYRDSSSDWSRGFGANSALRWLIGLTIAVFIGQNIQSLAVTDSLAMTDRVITGGQVWRLLTYAFCHATENPLHLVFNLLVLWWFGRALEERLGTREFVAFYLSAALFAAVCYLGLQAVVLKQPAGMLGASGAVMAVMAVYAMWYPRQQVMFMMLFPIEIRWLIAAYVVYETIQIGVALSGQEVHTGVAHAAHLGGLLFGFLYQFFELRLSNWLSWRGVSAWWRDRLRRRSMRLYTPEANEAESQSLDGQVDDILRKIHEQGESSLTDRERKLLNEASRRYRERVKS